MSDALYNAETAPGEDEQVTEIQLQEEGPRSHRILRQPGFVEEDEIASASPFANDPPRPVKRRRLQNGIGQDTAAQVHSATGASDSEGSAYNAQGNDTESASDSALASELASDTDEYLQTKPPTGRKRQLGQQKSGADSGKDGISGLDDGNEKVYQTRLESWTSRRRIARQRARARDQVHESSNDDNIDEEDEIHLPHPTVSDTALGEGYRVPGDIYPSLFDYQKTGVQWLWELYSQQVGGIVGDEMGLGKTIQVISFLAGLHYSKKVTKPIIVVAPATVMKQWVNEFHTWWPPFRVSILHSSGSGMIDIGREAQREEELLSRRPSQKPGAAGKAQRAANRIVERVVNEGHVLVTTYSGLQTYAELLVPVIWEYAVLDEGHKIRNPNAGESRPPLVLKCVTDGLLAITLYSKELRTPNRIILSGTPMQNNLIELWSLFDFIFPMRLGNLVDFKGQFEIPIRIGGYANASNLQIQTATKCAETLKDAISPYLLQRMKSDVAADLPKKTERVLFCKLTKPQREAYETFLSGEDMTSIMGGKRQVLYGVDILRKICNHPDLQDHRGLSIKAGYNYGSGSKSGKMVVVKELLDVWRKGGHKTLLFAQHRIMLDILETYLKKMEGLNYRRMDGTTPIASRQAMVDEFNSNPDAHVFLLTTKVGGLGINLTGADRVIIYDPDWNPSTDIQARERAWRLGQKREVEIYRLMVAGTIEEKIFHRQVFKQFLTNKILRDPKQRQTFQMSDLHDLFTLGDANEEATQTSRLFEGTEVKFKKQPSTSTSITSDPLNTTKLEDNGSKLNGIVGISSVRPYAQEATNATNEDETQDTKASEQRIMEGIFARSGVHSALEHDQIINGKRVVSADPQIIEREARRVAEEAATELRRAEEVARTIPAGVPTWTGQFGTGGRRDQAPSSSSLPGVPSSAGILAGLTNKPVATALNASAAATSGTPDSSRSSTPLPTSTGGGRNAKARFQRNRLGKDFLPKIRDFIVAHGGKVYTQNLIDHFNRYCTTAERTAEFKAMIREIATLTKGSRGRGMWSLKEEFRASSSAGGQRR